MNRNADNHQFSRPANADIVHGTSYLLNDPTVARRSHAEHRARYRPAPATLPLPHDVGPQLLPRIDPFTEAAILSGEGRG